MDAKFLTQIDGACLQLTPIYLGAVPPGRGTPHAYVVLEDDGRPLLRLQLYGGCEPYAFEQAGVWNDALLVGWGHWFHFVNIKTQQHHSINLEVYFGSFQTFYDFVLVASGRRVFRIEKDGSLKWRSKELGVDGIKVERVEDGIIFGEGEWTPPGGWRPFELDLCSGRTKF